MTDLSPADRSRARARALPGLAAGAVLVVSLAACGGSADPTAVTTPASASGAVGGGSLIVGSANFSESRILAEIYAGALSAKGVTATTRLNIGSREIYLKALEDTSIDLVPEYTGSLLSFYDKAATAKAPDEVYAAVKGAIPPGFAVLDKSAAEDKNSIVVTKETAAKWSLTSIGDLAAHNSELTVGAPPEFQTRQQGLVGLKAVYGVEPATFLPRAEGLPELLANGQIQATNIYTTDPVIPARGFVVLGDPKALFGSDNVVPLLRKDKVNTVVTTTLNAVSAKLTTAGLTDLLKAVDTDKKDAKVVAKEWLTANNLG
ncbi:MAG: ABC transporter substrate-binding protein [Candidatus Phosphoribacter sp.]